MNEKADTDKSGNVPRRSNVDGNGDTIENFLKTLQNVYSLSRNLETECHKLQEIDSVNRLRDRFETGRVNQGRDLAEFAQKIWAGRFERRRFFPSLVLSEASWDMLLYLFAQRANGRISLAATVLTKSHAPINTARRYLNILENEGLVIGFESSEHHDHRYVQMTDAAYERMARCLLQSLGLPVDDDRISFLPL